MLYQKQRQTPAPKQPSYGRAGFNRKTRSLLCAVLGVFMIVVLSSLALAIVTAPSKGSVLAYPPSGIAVSVVVPVYNVRPYIEKCLKSLLRQTLSESLIELIFVDDMSTDGSFEFINEYALRDPRVRLLRNDRNLGSGESRNFGMSVAKGEYIGFMDSDDSVDEEFYEKLYLRAKAKDLDIVKGASFTVNASGVFESAYNRVVERRLRLNRKIFEAFHYQHQTAIYRKSVLDAHPGEIHFGNYSNAQDCMFLLSYGMYARSIGVQNDAKYYYLVRNDSASHNLNERFFRGNLLSMNDRLDFLESHMRIGSYNSYLKTYRKIMKERRKSLEKSTITDPEIVRSIDIEFNATIKRISNLLEQGKGR